MNGRLIDDRCYSLIFPGPNPTGDLHLGHVLNLLIQDTLCRWNYANGKEIYWAAMVDHGGITTQSVFERQLFSNASTSSAPRDASTWLEEKKSQIFSQLARFDTLLDLSRRVSILDDASVRWMHSLLGELHAKGYVSRKWVAVPWSPTRQTYVAPYETRSEKVPMEQYLIAYKHYGDSSVCAHVWVENLEEIAGDYALAISSKNKVYQEYVGSYFVNPEGRRIPLVVSDDFKYQSVESDVARVVPGHCERSSRLLGIVREDVRAFDPHGKMVAGRYMGRTRKEARRAAQEFYDATGKILERRTEHIPKKVYVLDGEPVEDYLTEQWFLDVLPMIPDAKARLRDGTVQIYPRHYHDSLMIWFEHAARRDSALSAVFQGGEWCISRQGGIGVPMPSFSQGDQSQKAILDTQLSCSLWTFCAHNLYARNRREYENLAANTACVAGEDVFLYWFVPNLLLASALDCGLPFRKVFVHPLVCDENGRKMSKSEGNVVSPWETVTRFGMDALRMSMLSMVDSTASRALRFRLDEVGEVSRSLGLVRETIRSAIHAGRPFVGPAAALGSRRDAIGENLEQFRFHKALEEVWSLAAVLRDPACFSREATKHDIAGVLSVLEAFIPETARELASSARRGSSNVGVH